MGMKSCELKSTDVADEDETCAWPFDGVVRGDSISWSFSNNLEVIASPD
jgi:hypothetical protein